MGVALVLTPDGFPLACEVYPGNTSDKGTQMAFIRKPESPYGPIGNLGLMDRGGPTEETLREMREGGYTYLVGAPRGHLGILGDQLRAAAWEEVQPGIRVKVARSVEENGKEGDTSVLTQSDARVFRAPACCAPTFPTAIPRPSGRSTCSRARANTPSANSRTTLAFAPSTTVSTTAS